MLTLCVILAVALCSKKPLSLLILAALNIIMTSISMVDNENDAYGRGKLIITISFMITIQLVIALYLLLYYSFIKWRR